MKSNVVRFPRLIHEDTKPSEAESSQHSPVKKDTRKTIESFSWTYEPLDNHLTHEKTMQNLDQLMSSLQSVKGFIGAAVANATSGMTMMTAGGTANFDIEVAAAANAEVIKAKIEAMDALGFTGKEHIEDILTTLDSQYHLIRLYKKDPSIFIYLALDKASANLALARRTLLRAEESLDF